MYQGEKMSNLFGLDFGFATKFSKGKLLTTFCGSCAYASPEILQGRRYNGAKADIWSM